MATARYVSSDIYKNWEKGAKNEFIKLCRSLLQGMQQNSPVFRSHAKDLKHMLYEVCWNVCQGTLRLEPTIIILSEVMQLHNDLPSIVSDILLLLDTETQCSDNRDCRERFFWLLNGCNKKVVPEYIIKERLEFETTGDAGILKQRNTTQTKFIKIKTRLFYKQQKFNLFREESEGYAKLITELNQEVGGRINSSYMLEVTRSLIGCFNLDPNRVLDIILESFECRLELANFYIPLLQSFLCNSATLSQVLGFKLSFYQNDTSVETPSSLYKVAALLLHSRLISLDQLYGMLVPDDNKILEKHKQELQNARTYARRANALIVSSDKTTENQDDNKDEDNNWQEDNQKLGLCGALLEVGDWEHAQQLITCLPEFYAVSHPEIAKKLCALIHVIVEPLYRRHCELPVGLKPAPLPAIIGITSVKQVKSYSGLKKIVFPMILCLGPHLHLDPILLVKIIRLAKYWMNEKMSMDEKKNLNDNATDSLEYDIITLLDEALLPSLSLLECNCCMAEELWSLLKLFPYQHRFSLYSQWKNETYLSQPLLIRAKADNLKKIKYIMKRLSKENVKPSGRQIGKLSHSCPGFLFDYILSQIQTWDNLIIPVVDSLKYLTSLSYDVLAYCIIEALVNPLKERMKHTGTGISVWLQSLSTFCGTIFKKYSIELTGLLQYVANQLKAEKSLDLLVLKEIVQKMAGIEASEEMTLDQLEAMAGGELLRAEGGYFNQMRNTKKSSLKLKEALLEQDLALPLCLLMAQQRNCILYREQEHSHLKLVSKLYDQCQDTLVQFGSFLSNNLSMEDYVNRLPPVDKLLSEYFIQSDVAFFLARPMFNYVINSKYEEMKKQDKTLKNMTSVDKFQKYVEAVERIMSPVVESIRPLQPPKTWDDLSAQFYVTFWSLSMYDLHVPNTSYEREINKLKVQISQVEENKDMAPSKKKKEKERCHALIEKLVDEEKRQQEHCSRVLARLKSEKDAWFQSRSAKNETITQFLQLCVFPRCVFTSIDALYCAKFVHLIHTLKTPNFSTLICYDRIFCDITYTVTACTENEASRYGRFLYAMLETVMRWHSDKSIFEKECANFPGFMTKFRGASQSSDSATDHVDYENYRHVCHKWHFKITKALVICLESGDYVQIRNSLIVLTKILPYFPIITNLGQALERRIDKIRVEQKEKRPDLYAIATGYSGQLKAKKQNLIPEHEFHLKETKDTKIQANSSTTSKQDHKVLNAINDSSTTENKIDIKDKEIKSENNKAYVVNKLLENPAKSTNSIQGAKRESNSNRNASKDDNVDVLIEKDIKHEKKSSSGNEIMSKKDETSERFQSSKDERKDRRDETYFSHHHPSEKDSADYGGRSVEMSSYRRSNDILENEREHKRRRTDGTSSKSPRMEERTRESNERELRNTEKFREEGERGSSKEKASVEKFHSREVEITDKQKVKDKDKEKKITRKRDHSDDSSGETKRKKEEEQGGKQPMKRNGDSEAREKERHRREDTSPKIYERRERRSDREEKKHHRSTSVVTSLKRRS